ncbi:all-trans-retinol 13,14-reductase-like [Ptychodera flava]|uniref:all-trans-retinol 13,14-reductase-like n=1 Tax=Ptychodera flava TaxID=63121 RepID=UPI00396A9B5F
MVTWFDEGRPCVVLIGWKRHDKTMLPDVSIIQQPASSSEYIMTVAASLFAKLELSPTFLVAAILTVIFIVVLSWFMKELKPDKNPFHVDTTRPLKPLVTDHSARDAVLKQGFAVKKVPDDLDAIVIGSGIGGLSVAALLARTGKKVLVLEQHDQAGGCCHTYIEKGFEFDVGIHYVGEMKHGIPTRTLVDQLTNGQLQWQQMDEPYDIIAIGEPGKRRYFPVYAAKDKYRESLIEKFPGEKKAIDKFLYLTEACKKCEVHGVIPKLVPTWLINMVISSGLINWLTPYFKYAQRSVQEVLEELTDNKDLRTVLSYNFGDYGVIPDESSFAVHAGLTNHFWHGAYYPVGGASEIAFHIIPTIEKAGGKVLVRAKVSQILLDKGGKATGVRVHKSSGDVDIHAPLIISDAGFFNTFEKLLPPHALSMAGLKHIQKDLKHGHGFISLFVGLKGTAEELGLQARHTWSHNGNDGPKQIHEYLEQSAEDAAVNNIPLLFISFPSAKDPSWEQRYPGKSVCIVITLANWEWFKDWENERVMKRGEEYDWLKNAIGERMWEQTCLLYPQLKDKVEYFEVGSPLSNKYYIGSPKGEIYGLDHNKERFTAKISSALRPQTNIPNLYMTGQDILTCGFAGGLYGGLICACSILKRNVMADLEALAKKIAKAK